MCSVRSMKLLGACRLLVIIPPDPIHLLTMTIAEKSHPLMQAQYKLVVQVLWYVITRKQDHFESMYFIINHN